MIAEALHAGDLPFPRSTRPASAVPRSGPTVVGFSDFTKLTYEARVFLRWPLEGPGDAYGARLPICKARVPPLSGLTVPRGELTALTLLSRLLLSVAIALQKLDYPPTAGRQPMCYQCC